MFTTTITYFETGKSEDIKINSKCRCDTCILDEVIHDIVQYFSEHPDPNGLAQDPAMVEFLRIRDGVLDILRNHGPNPRYAMGSTPQKETK